MATIRNLERRLDALEKCLESDEKLREAIENKMELLREIRDEGELQRNIETAFALLALGYFVGCTVWYFK